MDVRSECCRRRRYEGESPTPAKVDRSGVDVLDEDLAGLTAAATGMNLAYGKHSSRLEIVNKQMVRFFSAVFNSIALP